jgi:two-component system cell cycle sensor histidine kinase/response regulator CckA
MTLKVLMIEDSASDAKLVAHALRATGRVVEIERVEEADSMREALQRGPWDLIVSDWSLPRFGARAALDIANESGLDLPFIIVSGSKGEEAAVDAMRAGAHDYVRKDNLARLSPAVERELRDYRNRVERRRTERDLEASEMRFARLAESGIVGIVFADILGNTFDANDAYLRMIGYTRDDLTSGALKWSELTPPEWEGVDAVAIEQLRTTGVAVPWEKELLRKDGSRVPVLLGVAMLEPPQCITFVADLTERKRAEDALKQSENQFRQAQKMEAVGQLAGGVAHDFNNMLSVILSYCDFVLEDLEPEHRVRADVHEIKKAGRRAADLTRQLLMFSRQQILEPKVLDLNELVAELDKMLHRLVGEDIDIVLSPGRGLGAVRADPGSIEQVVMNLVVNARDAMPTGGKLTIETANVELDPDAAALHHGAAKSGPHVKLAVSDTGIGMDEATQGKIFEPFFTTKGIGKGTGLGLSTVFGIVHQSGGAIRVHSELGVGTSFEIYLPRVDAAAEQLRASAGHTSLRGSETVLLVEDEDQVRAVALGILRRHGYRVIEARSPTDALTVCEREAGPIELLLTDVVMPHMSGPELARRVVELRPDVKVLCMSGYTDDAAFRHGVLESGVAFLQKPLTVEALTRKVRDVLDGVRR